MSFLGDDPGGVQTSTSLPVLSGGLHVTGGGTLPRPKSSSNRLTGLFNQPKAVKVVIAKITFKNCGADLYSYLWLYYMVFKVQSYESILLCFPFFIG